QPNTAVINELEISFGSQMPPTFVGDFYSLLGTPDGIDVQWGNHSAWPALRFSRYHAQLDFDTSDFAVGTNVPVWSLVLRKEAIPYPLNVEWQGYRSTNGEKVLVSIQG